MGEELVNEFDAIVEKEKAKKARGRAPGAPTQNQRRKRARIKEIAAKQLAPQMNVDDVDLTQTDNPRFSTRESDSIPSRRREQIWKAREENGYGPQRREILDSKGRSTGATTSNLE